ncbi:transporter [Urechidicola sp. KH5]
MKNFIKLFVLIYSTTIFAQHSKDTINKWNGNRPDGHAPISVMGDHMHSKGDWMFSYRYMNMQMKDMIEGDKEVSADYVHSLGYMVAPIEMTMHMHMIGFMYAPSNKVTLMAMSGYVDNSMGLQMRQMTGMVMPFETASSGFSDLKVSTLYKFFNNNRQSVHGLLGLSIPTGSIEEKDVTPMSSPEKVFLPYPMQIGSGTVDAHLGLTYLGQRELYSWGNQFRTILRLGENSYDYTLGHQYQLNNWFAYKVSNWISLSARIDGLWVSEIRGEHSELNPMMVATADTDNSGGFALNSGFGANFYIPDGAFKNMRLGLEYVIPLYQNMNGVQLGTKSTLTIGLQYAL